VSIWVRQPDGKSMLPQPRTYAKVAFNRLSLVLSPLSPVSHQLSPVAIALPLPRVLSRVDPQHDTIDNQQQTQLHPSAGGSARAIYAYDSLASTTRKHETGTRARDSFIGI
jgi:hypothetical protein